MKKALIFDLDGTLVDTLSDLAAVTNTVLFANGYPTHPLDAYRQFVGNGGRRLVEEASGETREDVVDRLFEEFLSEYDRHCLDLCKPYPGVVETLQTLKRCGMVLAIYTNKPQVQAEKIVDCFFKDTFFEVIGHTPNGPKKPDPAPLLHILSAYSISPEQAAFVGDSNVDVQTAHNAGLECVGAAYGFRGKEELLTAGADILIDEFVQLIKIFNIS
ncbi:MAG: HAD-IIIA family hydrolase [Clostridia bacterium]|nr:HAD-IIIA family hydrolase [Clostridia bacterium]